MVQIKFPIKRNRGYLVTDQKIFKNVFMNDLQQICATSRRNIFHILAIVSNNISTNLENTAVLHDGVPSKIFFCLLAEIFSTL